MKQKEYSPALYHYLKKYQQDPRSRVFAPLAEAYRKAGLLDEAIEIVKEGLTKHPGFIGGRVALARAYFDKGLYQKVLDEMIPVVQEAPDNLAAQKLTAESYLLLGSVEEALQAFKLLLYYHPQDSEVAEIVRELEEKSIESRQILQNDFRVADLSSVLPDDPQVQEQAWKRRIEVLQGLLQRIERYRWNGEQAI